MRREISEVKPVETKSRENYLDSSVRKAFERLQEGKTARAENKLDSSVRKSFEKLESHSTYEKRLQQKMENPEKDLQKLVGEYLKDLKSKSECANPTSTNQIQLAQDYGKITLIKESLCSSLEVPYLPKTPSWFCLLKCEVKCHNIGHLSSQH